MMRDDRELRWLFEQVVVARSRHRQQLRERTDLLAIAATREATLAALEDYASAIVRQGLPVPPAVNRDLRLLRALCESGLRQAAVSLPDSVSRSR
jgi:hypothetical protein